VSIVVDQLRGDYLQYFATTFGEKGFRRLTNSGLVYSSVDFGFPNLSESTAVASLYTGTYPYYHGITGDHKYDTNRDRPIPILADDRYLGNYTSDRFSPLSLLASTVADELKIASGGRSQVYAIAPNAPAAILAGGRYADGAFWLDDYNGRWATSTYYKESPPFVDQYNASEAPGNFTEKQWTQSYTWFNGLPYSTREKKFAHRFPKSDNERFIKMKQTALINTEVTNLAVRFLEYAGFGNSGSSDLLAITYYAGNYSHAPQAEEYSYEIQDTYARLDQELERLLDAIDRRVGLKQTLIVLTSTGYYDCLPTHPPLPDPAPHFHPRRCTALLNLYLMALYGQEDWVSAYYDRQIFLNRKLIEDRQIPWAEFVGRAAEFLSQFSGVQHVTTALHWLIDDPGTAAATRRGMHRKTSGDLFIELQPGWVVVDDGTAGEEPARDTFLLAPLYLSGEGIPHRHISETVPATALAPTLSHLLRIRRPNASQDRPLKEILP
jgi:hypothetical protein